jgi:hypothetical protein
MDRLELTRFLHIAQTITIHHAALAYLQGIHALRASEVAEVRARIAPIFCVGTAYCTWSAREQARPEAVHRPTACAPTRTDRTRTAPTTPSEDAGVGIGP